VLLGGRHATQDPAEWLESCPRVGAVVRGDGEETVEEFCRSVPLEEITGLSFRTRTGEIRHTPNRTPGKISETLIPARHLRKEPYHLGFGGVDTGILVDMLSSSRGCPFQCGFCSFNRNPWGKKRDWSARSPESVVDEIAGMEAKIIGLTDDLFTFDMNRVERICDLLIERGIRKKYVVNARLEIARRPDVLRKMERAGFFMLMLGVESTQDKTLRAMKKGFDRAKIVQCFEVLKKSRMILHGYFILGCIGETVEEMREISGFAHALGLDSIALSILRASPYSGLDELVAASPGYHIGPNGKIYSDHCSTDALRLLRREVYSKFFTSRQIFRIVRKGVANGFLKFLPGVLPRLPRFLWDLTKGRRAHAKRRRERRRVREEAVAAKN
jgi:magnesium-protoporphyrin IX monomethyl ester (oxidative) cyclase